jgi:hypothetical protein
MKKVSLKRGIKPNKKACGRKNSTLSPQAETLVIQAFLCMFILRLKGQMTMPDESCFPLPAILPVGVHQPGIHYAKPLY